jgi:hypothetical protein
MGSNGMNADRIALNVQKPLIGRCFGRRLLNLDRRRNRSPIQKIEGNLSLLPMETSAHFPI